jgi:hypothetical protein
VVIFIHVSCTKLIYLVAIRFLAIKCFSVVFDFDRLFLSWIYSQDRSHRMFL